MSRRTVQTLLILFEIAAFAYFAWLRIDNARIVHEPRSFGDTHDYFHNASLPVFSREFWTDARPPVTALFWKMVGADPEKIFNLQLYFSIVCWGVLAFVTAAVLRQEWLKPFAFVLVLAFTLSRDIYMWDPFLGSESISLSWTALFLAASLWLLRGWSNWNAALVALTGLFMVFSRDTYAYLLLMIAAAVLVLFWFSAYRWQAAGISAAFLVIFLLSSELATLGLRPYRAILMNTAMRIYPSEVYTEYFRQHGMPIDERLVEIARNPEPGKKFTVNIAFTFDKDQEAFRQWALGPGRSEYLKFLWFYKAQTLQSVFLETPGQSLYPDVYYYTATGYHPIIKDERIREILYPTRFGVVFFFAANLFAAFAAGFAWRDRKTLWLAPLLMILLSYPQAVLVWAADANDISRHSIAFNIFLRLGGWFLILFIADSLLETLISKWRGNQMGLRA